MNVWTVYQEGDSAYGDEGARYFERFFYDETRAMEYKSQLYAEGSNGVIMEPILIE